MIIQFCMWLSTAVNTSGHISNVYLIINKEKNISCTTILLYTYNADNRNFAIYYPITLGSFRTQICQLLNVKILHASQYIIIFNYINLPLQKLY